MKKVLLSVLSIALWIHSNSQNVGIGTNNPKTKLQVEGAISSTPVSAPAQAAYVIPDNTSVFFLTLNNVSNPQANALSMALPQEGQLLTILNADDDAATFAGFTIPANNGTIALQYIGGSWRLTSAPSSGSGNYIQNNTVGNNYTTGQGASFDVTGNGEVSGTLSVGGGGTGQVTPTGILDVNGGASTSGPGKDINLKAQDGNSGGNNNGGNVNITAGQNANSGNPGKVNINTLGTSTGDVNISNGTANQTVGIANNNTGVKNVTIGGTNASSSVTINAGATGGVTVGTLTSGGNSYVKANSTGKLSPQTGVPTTDLSGTVAVGNLPDATTSTKGIVQLAGDLGGTSTSAAAPVISNNAVTTAKIADANVTYAKIQNVAASSLIGNATGSPAAPTAISLGTGLSFSGTTLNSSGGTVTSVTGSNGLTATPSGSVTDVKLGGTLNAATTIVTAGNNLYFTGAGNVGIGDNSAPARLYLKGDGTNPIISAVDNTNVVKVYVDPAGKVGLNTNLPGVSLDVRTTDAVKMPSGTTAQRPSSPLAGTTRFNTDNSSLEYYDGTQWVSANTTQVPIGTITSYAASTAPSGWLICDGTAVSRTTYSLLFAAIGTTYGAGDGSTTFNLPDLRGRVPFGLSSSAPFNSLAAIGGTTSVTPTMTPSLAVDIAAFNASLPNHTHSIPAHYHGIGTGTGLATTATTSGAPSVNATSSAGNHTHTFSGTTSTTGNHTHNVGLRSNDGGWAAGNPNAFHYAMSSGGGGTSTSDRGATSNANTGIIIATGDHAHTFSGTTSDISTQHTHDLGNHTHSVPSSGVTGSIGLGSSGGGVDGNAAMTSGNPSAANVSVDPPSTSVTGSVTSSAVSTVNPFQVVNYIIKATNTATSSVTAVNVPSGSFGQTLYYNSGWTPTSNVYNNGTSVGIGVTSPGGKLHVGGQTRISGASLARLTFEPENATQNNLWNLDNQGGLFRIFREDWAASGNGANGLLGMSISNAGVVTIPALGSGLIKATSGTLAIASASDFSSTAILNQTTQQSSSNFNISGNGTIAGTTNTPNVTTTSGNLTLSGNGWGMNFIIDADNNSNDNYIFNGNGAEIMRLQDDGKLGIGTSSPGATLDIGGTPAVAYRDAYFAISGNNSGVTDRPYFRGTTSHLVIAPGTSAGASTMYLAYPNDLVSGNTVNTRIQETIFITATGSGGGGSVGIGNASPTYTLDVTGSIRATSSITDAGFDFILGNGDQSSRGNSGASRALVKNTGAVLDVNYGNDFSGGTRIGSLTGSANRKVYADASGLLNTSGSVFASRSGDVTFSNYTSNILTTGNMNVTSGDVIALDAIIALRNGGGSGNDRWRVTFRVNNVSGCSSSTIGQEITATPYQDHNSNHDHNLKEIWVATCTGTVTFTLDIERYDSDDGNSVYSTIKFLASKE